MKKTATSLLYNPAGNLNSMKHKRRYSSPDVSPFYMVAYLRSSMNKPASSLKPKPQALCSEAHCCNFRPFRHIQNRGLYLHRRKKAVFYVGPELLKPAEKAAAFLSDRIGIDLFDIRRDKGIDEPKEGGRIYIESEEDNFKLNNKKLDSGTHLAYSLVRGYNKSTGEIYESDIVFNPRLYDYLNYYNEMEELSYSSYSYKKLKSLEKEMAEEIKIEMEEEMKMEEAMEQLSYKYIVRIMIHKLGHALGYKYTPDDIENIMYPSIKDTKSCILTLTEEQVNSVLCVFRLKSGLS